MASILDKEENKEERRQELPQSQNSQDPDDLNMSPSPSWVESVAADEDAAAVDPIQAEEEDPALVSPSLYLVRAVENMEEENYVDDLQKNDLDSNVAQQCLDNSFTHKEDHSYGNCVGEVADSVNLDEEIEES